MLLIDILRHLHARGYAPEYRRPGRAFLSWAARDDGAELIARFQRYHDLPDTGRISDELISRITAPRCGHPDRLAITGPKSAWALTALTYWQQISYPGVDPADLAADYALAVQRVTSVCGLTVTLADSAAAANIIAGSGPIDGAWNVLALSELPPPQNVQLTLKQKFDVAETALTRDQRQAMIAHEFCHALGLGHAPPGSGALMEPALTSFKAPQAWDTAELLARYPLPADGGGGPGGTPGPAPPTAIGGGNVPVIGTGSIVTSRQAGAQYTVTLDGPGKYLILIVPAPPE